MEIRSSIEKFHLLWCSQLAAKVDRKLWCLKGGCNLRFFFNSIRYSEDIDLDVVTVQPQTLKRNVDKILNSKDFQTLLISRGLELVDWSAPKQTDTTQRWKAAIGINGLSTPIPTKIEFSRRTPDISNSAVEFVNSQITQYHKLQPLLIQHYNPAKATKQKIQALKGRVETQARDIIDLKFLKDSFPESQQLVLSAQDKELCGDVLMSIGYDDFMSQVWPYLMTEYQDYYQIPKVWDQIQEDVLLFIQNLPEKE
ncbi:MAG: nucleotidyl transferase AbiEii/AbiGii toxin family protein [Bdellovibrionaceae bacterium]|nr:nucleotidyl transferase AbiEii/AbiGii toxin family protein [Bdellovibrionales bacterium]MCB9084567.1 nucleotidyl transferase AbiEii/AbiGii toxin family protein [Pseudobdellovibrionaceae bacterium]